MKRYYVQIAVNVSEGIVEADNYEEVLAQAMKERDAAKESTGKNAWFDIELLDEDEE